MKNLYGLHLLVLACLALSGCAQAQEEEEGAQEHAATSAPAKRCEEGALSLTFINVQTFAVETLRTAEITGQIDTPHPNYDYRLTMDDTLSESDRLHGTLELYVKNPDQMHIQVITPLSVSGTIKVPQAAKEVVIKVEKPFSWGPKQYTGSLEDKQSLCLQVVSE